VSLGKAVGLEVLYNFGLYKFFPLRAVTMGCYSVHARTSETIRSNKLGNSGYLFLYVPTITINFGWLPGLISLLIQ